MKSFRAMIVALALLAPSTACALTASHAGGRAGVSLSKTRGGFEDGRGTLPGFAGGGFVRFPLTSMLTLQPELLYVAKGHKDPRVTFYLNGDPIGTADRTFKVGYLELPVLLRASLPGGTIRPLLLAGPVVSVELEENLRVESRSLVQDLATTVRTYPTDSFRSLDFGGAFGAGLDVHSSVGIFSLEGRWTLGLLELNDQGERNSSVMITLGFAAPASKR